MHTRHSTTDPTRERWPVDAARGRAPRWRTRRTGLAVLIALLVVIVPIAAALITMLKGEAASHEFLEFLIGTWPNQQYTAVPMRHDFWLYAGVFVRSLVIFGLPAILGLLIVKLTAQVERVREDVARLSHVDGDVIDRYGRAIKQLMPDARARQELGEFVRRLGGGDADVEAALDRFEQY